LPALLALAALGACKGSQKPREVVGGDAELGRQAIQKYGCGTCHTIPGVEGASGRQAQILLGFADRGDIAGMTSNLPENLVRWIQRPQDIYPRAKMPSLGVPEKDARDIAAYLYTLKAE
jgi:cytochrome c2